MILIIMDSGAVYKVDWSFDYAFDMFHDEDRVLLNEWIALDDVINVDTDVVINPSFISSIEIL